jgi:hypothetical protein
MPSLVHDRRQQSLDSSLKQLVAASERHSAGRVVKHVPFAASRFQAFCRLMRGAGVADICNVSFNDHH